jgi:hypothetical protein
MTINGSSIQNRSISGRKLRRSTITGAEINKTKLGRVPHALNADEVGGMTADALKVRCPNDTFPAADVCVERIPRAPASYRSAVLECAQAGTPAGPGRRLPTHGELEAALTGVQLAAGGELTSDVSPSSASPGRLDVVYVTDQVGNVAVTPDTGAGAKAFRCVTDPLN